MPTMARMTGADTDIGGVLRSVARGTGSITLGRRARRGAGRRGPGDGDGDGDGGIVIVGGATRPVFGRGGEGSDGGCG